MLGSRRKAPLPHMIQLNQALPPALPGEMHDLSVDGVRFVLYARELGSRDPILLIHSVNAAASAYEVRPLYEGLPVDRSVYALDLPGYGRSDRLRMAYTPELMTSAIATATQWVQERHHDAPIDALALSLSCEFLARAAVGERSTFRTVAFVAATGLEGRWGRAGDTLSKPIVRSIVTAPCWSGGLFRALTRPGVIRFFLRKTWGRKSIDEGLQAYCELTTRVHGAEHAPLAFLSGDLFSADASTLFESLELPVWSAYGVRGDFADYGASESLRMSPHWRMQRFETGALPHFEIPDEFIGSYAAFLDENDS